MKCEPSPGVVYSGHSLRSDCNAQVAGLRAAEAKARIRTMGASTGEVLSEIKALVILAVIYGGLACIGTHIAIGREQRCGCSDSRV